MINCIIVDDEPLAREGLMNYVREVNFLQLSATCENPVELTALLGQQSVDLLFLDIQMPKMNGIEFLKMTPSPPMVIITTAYPSFALEGFQLNVLDYLLKPVTFERFFRSVSKAKDYFDLKSRPAAGGPQPAEKYFFIKCGSKFEKIHFDEILYVEGSQNYVTIHTVRGKYMTLLYLKNLEEQLDPAAFIRVHKSYIVACSKIDGIDGSDIFIRTNRIPLSRNYREKVIGQVVANKLWIK